jgi:hypothetical protein
MTVKSYIYRIHGLTIHSEVELPDLPTAGGPADVSLTILPVPFGQESPHSNITSWHAQPGLFSYFVKDIGKFVVSDGCRISIQPYQQTDPLTIRAYLFGICMAVVLLQRGILPLHASAIATDGGCLVFAGQSGAGKSTIATAFHILGHQVLADDMCAISLSADGTPYLLPGNLILRISTHTAAILRISTSNLQVVSTDTVIKYQLPIQIAQPVDRYPIQALYTIKAGKAVSVEMIELFGKDKITSLLENTFTSPEINRSLGTIQEHFHICSRIARKQCIKNILRPSTFDALDALTSSIIADSSFK